MPELVGNGNSVLAVMEDNREVMEVNFFGSVRVTEVFEPLIIKAKGRIIQVISLAGRVCVGGAPYTCSKFALEPYADELRRNIKQFGVKFCSIEPAIFNQTSLLNISQYKNVMTQRFQELPDWKKKHLGSDFVEKEIEIREGIFNNSVPLLSKGNTNIGVVTEAITHGLGAKPPKSRYVVGSGSRILLLLTEYTPDWLVDRIVS